MAVAPTGNIFKALSFDNVSSRTYGVYITGEAVYNAPERDVEMISIPGRNGAFALDKGRFENIEVSYPAGIFADNETDFAEAISDFRNFLCSRNGYARLTDEYNPNEYRMAIYKSGLEVSPAQLKAGEFDIVFDCKPQRWLTSGEEVVTIGEWGETETASGSIASFEAKDGDAVKSLVADINPIQSLNGYDKPWSGGSGKNLFDEQYPNIDGSMRRVYVHTGTGTFTLSTTAQIVDGSANLFFQAGQATSGESTGGNGVYSGRPRTVTSSDGYVTISYRLVNGTTDAGNPTKCKTQLESGSSATTYEPYSNICPISGYDSVVVTVADDHDSPTVSNTYTTNLSGTRYGGTLDVASGVLTVTKAIVDLGSLTWSSLSTSVSGKSCFNAVLTAKDSDTTRGVTSICEQYITVRQAGTFDAIEGYTINSNTIYMYAEQYSTSTAAQFKSALNGVHLCYELATPTTVQLTAEEVELLVGLNQVWTNSGDVTVDYGTAPNVLINPTLFGSSPMLEVTGHGEISLNGEVMAVNNEPLGQTKLSKLGNANKVTLDVSNLNTGDSIYKLEADKPQFEYGLSPKSGSFGTFEITSVSTCTAYISGTPTKQKLIIVPNFPQIVKGTNTTVSASVGLTITLNGTTYNGSVSVALQYSGSANTIGMIISRSGMPTTTDVSYSPYYQHPAYYGDSTKLIAPTPMYLDLDIGEAYGIVNGEVVFFNNIVSLPAELPKLKAGNNTITFDNTVTDLKVVPRWWKI